MFSKFFYNRFTQYSHSSVSCVTLKRLFHRLQYEILTISDEIQRYTNFGKLYKLKNIVFELTFFEDLLTIFLEEISHKEQIQLLTYKNHYSLVFNLHKFFHTNKMSINLCKRCIIATGSNFGDHLERCIEQKNCKKSCMKPYKKIKSGT